MITLRKVKTCIECLRQLSVVNITQYTSHVEVIYCVSRTVEYWSTKLSVWSLRLKFKMTLTLFQDYLDDASIAGFSYVHSRHHWVTRLFWVSVSKTESIYLE